jgi:hypothetical protein
MATSIQARPAHASTVEERDQAADFACKARWQGNPATPEMIASQE